MSDDLDEFLRQAAERRRKRQQDKASRPPIGQPEVSQARQATPPPPPLRPSQPAPPVRTLRPSQDDAYERGSAASTAKPSPNEGSAYPQGPYSSPQHTPEARRLKTQFDQPNSTIKSTVGNNLSSRQKPLSDRPRNIGQSGSLGESLSQQSTFPESGRTKPAANNAAWQSQNIAEQLRNPNALPLGTILVLGEVLKRPWE